MENIYKIEVSGAGFKIEKFNIEKETPKTYKVSGGWESVINKDKIDIVNKSYFGSGFEIYSLSLTDEIVETLMVKMLNNLRSKIDNMEDAYIFVSKSTINIKDFI